MNNKLQQILEQLVPFFLFGIAVALIIGLFIMLSYALFWGLVLGALVWIGVKVKNYFSPSFTPKDKGRVIEHDDID